MHGREVTEERFARSAVRRKGLFLALSLAGVAVAVGLGAWFAYRASVEPDFPWGIRAVLVVLILLNARLNLRQYRYACALERLLERRRGDEACG